MSGVLKQHGAEALLGLLVVLVASAFIWLAWDRNIGSDRYELKARFSNVSGVSVGTDVRLSGMKVGTVTRQSLDQQTFQAVLTIAIDQEVKLPLDSSAAITSDGLLGGAHIALIPGAEEALLRPGDEISDTQGATDLMGLIGALINRSGDAPSGPSPSAASP